MPALNGNINRRGGREDLGEMPEVCARSIHTCLIAWYREICQPGVHDKKLNEPQCNWPLFTANSENLVMFTFFF